MVAKEGEELRLLLTLDGAELVGQHWRGVFPGGCGSGFSGCVMDDVVVDDEQRLPSETCK